MDTIIQLFSHPAFSSTVAFLAVMGGLTAIGWRMRDTVAKKNEKKAAQGRSEKMEELLLQRDINIQNSISDLAVGIDKLADSMSAGLKGVSGSISQVAKTLEKSQSEIHEERMEMIKSQKKIA